MWASQHAFGTHCRLGNYPVQTNANGCTNVLGCRLLPCAKLEPLDQFSFGLVTPFWGMIQV